MYLVRQFEEKAARTGNRSLTNAYAYVYVAIVSSEDMLA